MPPRLAGQSVAFGDLSLWLLLFFFFLCFDELCCCCCQRSLCLSAGLSAPRETVSLDLVVGSLARIDVVAVVVVVVVVVVVALVFLRSRSLFGCWC